MRKARFYRDVAVLVAIAVIGAPARAPGQPPAPAQQQPMAVFTDPKARFTIEYPAAWEVQTKSGEGEKSEATFLGGRAIRFGWAAVQVFGAPPAEVRSPQELARGVQAAIRKDYPSYQSLQDGPANIAGHEGYYFYYTRTEKEGASWYYIRVYMLFPARTVVLSGGMPNDARLIQDNFPLILRILWSFRPT